MLAASAAAAPAQRAARPAWDPQEDIGLVEVISPPDTVVAGEVIHATVTAQNNSSTVLERRVSLSVMTDSARVYTASQAFTVQPQELCTLDLPFYVPLDSAALTLRFVLVPPDTNPRNDTLEKTVWLVPEFGAVLEQWDLGMSGSFAGAGVTWYQDQGVFFLVDQGYSGPCGVWSLDPADPVGTLAEVPWQYVDLGSATADIPYGICWDDDSSCFWTSQIVDGDVYGGCYLLRHTWNGDSWVWGGAPGDSWQVSDSTGPAFWIAGIEKWPGRGFIALRLGPGGQPASVGFRLFDPYGKVERAIIGDSTAAGSGLTLVPFDSSYILTCGETFRKYNSTGGWLQGVPTDAGACDWALHVPDEPAPDDTVCAWCICNDQDNTLLRVSLGMTWSQLPTRPGVAEGREPGRLEGARPASIVRGMLFLNGGSERGAGLLDACGRRVMELVPGQNDISRLSPGVYFVLAGSFARDARRVVVAR